MARATTKSNLLLTNWMAHQIAEYSHIAQSVRNMKWMAWLMKANTPPHNNNCSREILIVDYVGVNYAEWHDNEKAVVCKGPYVFIVIDTWKYLKAAWQSWNSRRRMAAEQAWPHQHF